MKWITSFIVVFSLTDMNPSRNPSENFLDMRDKNLRIVPKVDFENIVSVDLISQETKLHRSKVMNCNS